MSAQSQQRPAGLWIVSIGALILGLLGCCVSLWGIAGLAMNEAAMNAANQMQQMGNEPDPFAESIRMQRELLPVHIAMTTLQVLVAVALLVGGSLLLAWKTFAPKVMAVICIVAAGLEVVGLAFGVWSSFRTVEIVKDMGEGAEQAAQMGMAFGLCFAVVWGGAKLIYFIGSVIYLRRPELRALFGDAESYDIRGD